MAKEHASVHVEHMWFELSVSVENGAWFSLYPSAAAVMPKDALFVGPVGPDMATQLRGLADRIDSLLDQNGGQDGARL